MQFNLYGNPILDPHMMAQYIMGQRRQNSNDLRLKLASLQQTDYYQRQQIALQQAAQRLNELQQKQMNDLQWAQFNATNATNTQNATTRQAETASQIQNQAVLQALRQAKLAQMQGAPNLSTGNYTATPVNATQINPLLALLGQQGNPTP